MTSKGATPGSLNSLRSTKEGLFDPYDVLALWNSTVATGSSSEIASLSEEIQNAGLLAHPLLQSSLKLQ
jgi:hypothetical protein